MKQYREAGFIHREGRPVAYFIQDTHLAKELKGGKAQATLQYSKVDVEQFNTLVRQGMVQFLTWENDSIVCRYCDEERKWLKKHKFNKDYINSAERNYWDWDAAFAEEHVSLAEKKSCLAVSACMIASAFGASVFAMQAYGATDTIYHLLRQIETLKKQGIFVTALGVNSATLALSASSSSIKFLNQAIDGISLLIDTHTLRNTLVGGDIKAFTSVKNSRNPKYLALADELDALTRTNLDKLLQENQNVSVSNTESSSRTIENTNMF